MKKFILAVFIVQFFLIANIPCLSYGVDAENAKVDMAVKQGAQDTYKLNTGDALKVTVYREPDLSGEFVVKEDGTITYPLVGSVDVKGLTRTEAESKITGILKQNYLVEPYVQVDIGTPSQEKGKMQIGRSVTILGCVERPGLYDMPVDKNLTALQLVALAGGFTRYAAINNTKIVRTKNGGQRETIYPNINSVVNGHSEDTILEPGDMVYVPERLF